LARRLFAGRLRDLHGRPIVEGLGCATLRFGQEKQIIKGFLDLIYTENPASRFGQLQEGGAFGRWFFVVLAIAAALGSSLLLRSNTKK
jgi:lipoprotein signal peptidase